MIELTLSLKETFIIGDVVYITCFKSKNANSVKFGIQAPRSIIILREELYLKSNEKPGDGGT